MMTLESRLSEWLTEDVQNTLKGFNMGIYSKSWALLRLDFDIHLLFGGKVSLSELCHLL